MPAGLCFLASLPVRSACSPRNIAATDSRPKHLPRTRAGFAMTAANPNDLLIVGCGHLGRYIAQFWRAKHSSATIVGETGTESSHAALREDGITPALAGTAPGKFPLIVFCAPPSKFEDYAAAAISAIERVSPNGRFLFTSSGSVHGPNAMLITETTPPDVEGKRSANLAEVERRVLAAPQGHVARLSGLYLVDRGAHSYWIERGSVSGSADGMVNLVHYKDVASAAVKILEGGPGVVQAAQHDRRVFLICGGKSTSRRGICEAALRHPLFEGKDMPSFSEEPAGPQRTYDGSWTRETLGWKPEFETFEDFMEADAKALTRL